jgi:hypothetical protein
MRGGARDVSSSVKESLCTAISLLAAIDDSIADAKAAGAADR